MHVGFTAQGRSRWRYFDTVEAALRAASEIEKRTGAIVAIEATP